MKHYPFTKAELQNAVAIVRNALLAALPADNGAVVFSDAFETKMHRRITHAGRRVRRRKRLVNVVAAFIAALIFVSTFFAVNVEARSRFFDWIKEVYENQIVYRFFRTERSVDFENVTIGWLPEGFVLENKDTNNEEVVFIYLNSVLNNRVMVSVERYDQDKILTISPVGKMNKEDYTIDDKVASFIRDDSKYNDLIVLDDTRGILIDIQGDLSKEEMTQVFLSIVLN